MLGNAFLCSVPITILKQGYAQIFKRVNKFYDRIIYMLKSKCVRLPFSKIIALVLEVFIFNPQRRQ